MSKKLLGPTTNLFPMPAVLVAVRVDDNRASVLTMAWTGVVGGKPPMLAAEIGVDHYSTPFIEREGNFTVNIPRTDQVVGVDYCGLVSGKQDPDKLGTCGWTLAPSRLVASPIIVQCPLNLECVVVDRLSAGESTFYLAEIIETHADVAVLRNESIVDALALDPLIFTPDGAYYRLGERVGVAWRAGEALRATPDP